MRTISLTHSRPRAVLPGPMTVAAALFGWLRRRHERARQEYDLQALDGHLRRDVGLAREATPAILPIYLVR